MLVAVDLQALLRGDANSNPYIRPGDFVHIPKAEQVFVVGNVYKPSSLPLNEPLTVSGAIARAGGVLPNTKRSRIRIVRSGPAGTAETYVDLERIEQETMSRINDALKKEGGELIRQAGSGVDDAQRLELVYGAEGSEERQMTLRDHWRIMRNHARLIISTAVVVTLLVTVWTMLSPDYYEGSARVEIDLETADPLPSEPETRVAALDPAYFATQLQRIRSPMVLEQVVKALDLPHDPIYKRYMGTGGRKIRQLLRLAFLAKKDPLIEGEPEEPPLATALDPAISHEDLKRSKDLEPFVRDLQRRLTVE